MSILVKGVSMPKGEDEGWMIALYDGKAYHVGTKEVLEAIEIPDKHGDLIDRDAFIKEACGTCDGACESLPCDCLNCAADCRCDAIKDIADAPTIIEAEEET